MANFNELSIIFLAQLEKRREMIKLKRETAEKGLNLIQGRSGYNLLKANQQHTYGS